MKTVIDYKERYLLLTKQYTREIYRADNIIKELVDFCVEEIADVEDVGVVAVAQEYLAE